MLDTTTPLRLNVHSRMPLWAPSSMQPALMRFTFNSVRSLPDALRHHTLKELAIHISYLDNNVCGLQNFKQAQVSTVCDQR